MCDKSLKMFEGPCGGGSGSAGDTEHVLMRVIASVQPQDTGHKAGGTHGGGGPPEHQACHPRRPRRGARAANLTKPPLKPGPRSLLRQARGGESLARAGPGVRRKTLPPEGTRAGNAPAAAAWLASATSKMGAEQGGDVGRVSRAPRAGRAPRGRSGDTGRPSPDRKRDLAVTEKLRVPPWLLKQSSEGEAARPR